MNISTVEQETAYACSLMKNVFSVMLDHPETLSVKPFASQSGLVIKVACDPSDLSKLIGNQGRTARALRTLLLAISKQNRYHLEFLQDSPAMHEASTSTVRQAVLECVVCE